MWDIKHVFKVPGKLNHFSPNARPSAGLRGAATTIPN